jgi:hypothetical protein
LHERSKEQRAVRIDLRNAVRRICSEKNREDEVMKERTPRKVQPQENRSV